ncbi:hypothetical protein BTN49_0680 [Candidatus Enterovibrio escicola]|uniref:Mobile element protein n=1 Tax=Candidatus Enterovibrio escicola TaxID=1927127 RepID=A0A2A5T6D4_9GAMM|nr:hypothetical protein BTN49_0680 [Candidatus Enterovibrio escacola]
MLMSSLLKFPIYTCISKCSKTVKIKYRLLNQGAVSHVVIEATALKGYDEGEWKTSKHSKEIRCI